MDNTELKSALAHCTGTEQWYRHPLNQKLMYTDGVRTFAKNAGGGAYWFLDIVATEVAPLQDDEAFISMSIKSTDGEAELEATDGNDNILWSRQLDFTDCPEGTWNFYLIDNVMLLPSEY
jgi:hypothetical protein